MESVLRDRLSFLTAVGCGVALGASGIYSFYKINRRFCEKIEGLTSTIEDLRQEVFDLKVASQAASQANTPFPCECFKNSVKYSFNQLDGGDINFQQENLHFSDDEEEEEEFYNCSEGSNDIEPVEINVQNNKSDVKNNVNHVKKGEMTLQEWLDEFDVLLNDFSNDKRKLCEKIKAASLKYGKTPDILWRMAKTSHLLSIAMDKQGDSDSRKKYVFESLKYAREALEKDGNDYNCHKWYSVALGSISDYVPIKEKIQNGYEFKRHVDLALELNPEDPTLHHMLGRWSYEVSSLSWMERKVASTLFSKVPECSYDDSLSSLLKAYELKPDWKENILFIAKIFINQKKYQEAIKWIDRGINLNSVGEDDYIVHEELHSLQSKYSKYR